MKAFVINRRDSDRVDAIGVTVEIALVSRSSAIPAGEDEDGALSSSAIVDAIQDCLFN